MKSFDSELTVVPLPLVRSPEEQPQITLEEVALVAEKVGRTGNRWHAFRAAIERSGLTEEEVRDGLGISAPHWATFQKTAGEKGAKHFNHQRHQQFQEIVGNTLLTQVDAYLAGLQCVPLKTALEQENEELRRIVEEQEKQHQYLLQALKEIKGP